MRAQTGRADLLRALHLGCTGPLPLMHDDHHCWGYVASEVIVSNQADIELDIPARPFIGSATTGPKPPPFRNPLRMPEIWVANTKAQDREEKDHDGEDVNAKTLKPLESTELNPPDEPLVAYQDMVPMPRLLAALQKAFSRQQRRGLHVAALVRASARREWPRQLPRLSVSRWCPELIVALDFNIALYPYRYDMDRLVELLAKHFPRSALRVWVGRHGPYGSWCEYPLRGKAQTFTASPFPWPQKGEALLLASDLGLLRNGEFNPWPRWVHEANARGVQPVVLAPLSTDDLATDQVPPSKVLRWSPDSRLRPEAIRAGNVAERDSNRLEGLLAGVAALRGVDPPLLRALRSSQALAPQDASLEGRLWAHPEVAAGHYAVIRPAYEKQHREAFYKTPDAFKSLVIGLAQGHHAHWPRVLTAAEQLRWVACAGEHPRVNDVKQSVRDFLTRLLTAEQNEQDETFRQATEYMLRIADDACYVYAGDLLAQLAGSLDQPVGEVITWALVQHEQALYVMPSEEFAPPGMVLAPDVGKAAPGQSILWRSNGRNNTLKLPRPGTRLLLPEPGDVGTLLIAGQETIAQRKRRPIGIESWYQSQQGAKEVLNLPWQQSIEIDANYIRYRTDTGLSGSPIAQIEGDEQGVSLELCIGPDWTTGERIRFRYIPPGTFLMGSPEGVGHDDEHPQHPVTLTEGFWMAETPCTQGQWLAVVGSNPSHFNEGADATHRPVENVSHDDVTTFLRKFKALLPKGVEAVLPTEAQWEYACRAGTQTAYWWGEVFDPKMANTDAAGNKGWNDRIGTSPVGRYPANPWGLVDMHGNVWEWCADDSRKYTANAQIDPEGAKDARAFAVRGGSWLAPPGHARSAYRSRRRPVDRSRSQGFRLCLRSSSTGPEGSA